MVVLVIVVLVVVDIVIVVVVVVVGVVQKLLRSCSKVIGKLLGSHWEVVVVGVVGVGVVLLVL